MANEPSDEGREQDGLVLRELSESDAEEVVEFFRVIYGDARPIDAREIVR